MRALVACVLGTAEVDLAEDEVVEITDVPVDAPALELDLPLVVSNDGGSTWREAGAGLAPGTAIAISPDDPDVVLYATEERLHVSRDGGRFWQALSVELPGITAVTLVD